MHFNFTVHVCGVTVLHYLHMSGGGTVSENSARRGCLIVEAMRSALLRSQSLRFHLISQRFGRSRRGKGGTMGRRRGKKRRGRHSNSVKQVPGEGSVEVGRQKAFPAGKKKNTSWFTLRSAGSPDSFSGDDEARGEEQNHRQVLPSFRLREKKNFCVCSGCRNPPSAYSSVLLSHF